MRILIVSDIHANLAALEAVLTALRAAESFEAVWCMGDTVGYGPQPRECIARLQELSAVWVAGNHERAVTGAMSMEEFNPVAAQAAEWTASVLTNDEKAALHSLPEVVTHDGATLVHGTLRDPTWEYMFTAEVALAHLQLQDTEIGFVGHTHIPAAGGMNPDGLQQAFLRRLGDGDVVRLEEGRKAVLNPGSVGQPRDEDNRASYAIYDTSERSFAIHRVAYEIKSTQKLMAEVGLPRWLIERLSLGR